VAAHMAVAVMRYNTHRDMDAELVHQVCHVPRSRIASNIPAMNVRIAHQICNPRCIAAVCCAGHRLGQPRGLSACLMPSSHSCCGPHLLNVRQQPLRIPARTSSRYKRTSFFSSACTSGSLASAARLGAPPPAAAAAAAAAGLEGGRGAGPRRTTRRPMPMRWPSACGCCAEDAPAAAAAVLCPLASVSSADSDSSSSLLSRPKKAAWTRFRTRRQVDRQQGPGGAPSSVSHSACPGARGYQPRTLLPK
jgi:hypothetical protein